MIDLRGRTALVTGGSRGIGRAAARLLAQAGADVALTYRTRAAAAEAAAAEVRSAGRRAAVLGGDLADPAAVERIMDAVRRHFGRIDLFVGNAGVWPTEDVPLRDMDPARWRETMAANLDAIFLSTRAALGLMPPGGRVVLVGSTAGQRGEAILFLCSDLARHVTGEILNVNGGAVLCG